MQKIILGLLTLFLYSVKAVDDNTIYQDIPKSQFAVPVGNANDFVDTLLKNIIKKYGHILDPHDMPDLGFKFEKRFLLITYRGQANLQSGELTGLQTLHRNGDCTMFNNKTGFYAVVRLGASELKFDYDGTLTYMGIVGPTVKVYGTVAYVSLKMEIEKLSGGKIRVKDLKVLNIEGLDIKIRNLGILTPFLKIITTKIMMFFKPSLLHILEVEFKDLAEETLQNLNLPIY